MSHGKLQQGSASAATCSVTEKLFSQANAVQRFEAGVVVATYYLTCLAHASYIVAAGGTAVVIDPRRDVDIYIGELERAGLKLKAVLLTHTHADFMSGFRDLADRMHCIVAIGAKSGATYPHLPVIDGDVFALAPQIQLAALWSPGHTPDCTSWVLQHQSETLLSGTAKQAPCVPRPLAAFTGDALFIGSCGRPDLVTSSGLTPEDCASTLFDTLTERLMQLSDETVVYPCHGAGSACGKGISTALSSTIGHEKRTNAALQQARRGREAFVKWLVKGQSEAPCYFERSVATNNAGASNLHELLRLVPSLPPTDFTRAFQKSAGGPNADWIIVDARPANDFWEAHILGSLNIQLGLHGGTAKEDGNFAVWLGTCVKPGTRLFFVEPPGKENEAVLRAARIGYDDVVATLKGGMQAWIAAGLPTVRNPFVQPDAAMLADIRSRGGVLLDVRTEDEFEDKDGHVRQAVNVKAQALPDRLEQLNKDKQYFVYCKTGFRATVAASLLERHGYKATDIGGYQQILATAPSECTCEKAAGLTSESRSSGIDAKSVVAAEPPARDTKEWLPADPSMQEQLVFHDDRLVSVSNEEEQTSCPSPFYPAPVPSDLWLKDRVV